MIHPHYDPEIIHLTLLSHALQVHRVTYSKTTTTPRKQLHFYDVLQEFISILFSFNILPVVEMFANQAFKCAVLTEAAAQQRLRLALVLLTVTSFEE